MNPVDLVNDYKNRCLEIVVKYIEEENGALDEAELLGDCRFITRAHFDDIIEERACIDLCGYPLCSNQLSDTTKRAFKSHQKYHIKNNKVYEISRRKNVCSDLCFKRVDFLRNQISTEPLYLRKVGENVENIVLYREKVGQSGDEVKLKEVINNVDGQELEKNPRELNARLKEETVMKSSTKRKLLQNERLIENKMSAPYVAEETFKELKDKFQKLNVQEKNVTNAKLELPNYNDQVAEDQVKVEEDVGNFEDFSDYMNKRGYFSNVDKLMEDIDNLSISTATSMTNLSMVSTESKRLRLKKKKFLQHHLSRMARWITDDTRKLLNVSVDVSQSQPLRDEDVLPPEDPEKKSQRQRWEYIQLCAKLDLEELEDEKYDQMVLNKDKQKKPKKKKLSVFKDQSNDIAAQDDFLAKVSSFFSGQVFVESVEEPQKKVRFKDEAEKIIPESNSAVGDVADFEKQQPTEAKDDEIRAIEEPEPYVPVTEGQRPQVKRRQYFLKEIQLFLREIFANQLETSEIDMVVDHIRSLVDTFDLRVETVRMGRKYNYLTCILLLRFLLLYNLIEDKFERLFEDNVIIQGIIEKFDLSTEQVDDQLRLMINPGAF